MDNFNQQNLDKLVKNIEAHRDTNENKTMIAEAKSNWRDFIKKHFHLTDAQRKNMDSMNAKQVSTIQHNVTYALDSQAVITIRLEHPPAPKNPQDLLIGNTRFGIDITGVEQEGGGHKLYMTLYVPC